MTSVLWGMLAGTTSLLIGITVAEITRFMGLPSSWTMIAGLLAMGSTFTIMAPTTPRESR